ncbi:hypothetical protein JTE90_018510 [Oedothorax gibbosus]|uniref:Uncharacterized protein n=1 Tax=Oedothorax gibbosus TaxID=931172 RepID=A0AAV6V1B6_9ARAC|nr:hypothetical protein JTE90_018510 [Oedothorax gibbosus]
MTKAQTAKLINYFLTNKTTFFITYHVPTVHRTLPLLISRPQQERGSPTANRPTRALRSRFPPNDPSRVNHPGRRGKRVGDPLRRINRLPTDLFLDEPIPFELRARSGLPPTPLVIPKPSNSPDPARKQERAVYNSPGLVNTTGTGQGGLAIRPDIFFLL